VTGGDNPQATEGATEGCGGWRGRRLSKRVANVRFKRRSLALLGSESAGYWPAHPGLMQSRAEGFQARRQVLSVERPKRPVWAPLTAPLTSTPIKRHTYIYRQTKDLFHKC
jgi:hypothetical protein